MDLTPEPVEVKDSLAHFRRDYLNRRTAFVMMKFGQTDSHDPILEGIRDCLGQYEIVAVRADEKEYHSDLFFNIQTYLYACSFGIAVFERLESEDFNPNVSLEVGYLMGLGKPVCLLKDRTLRSLQADLTGKLHKSFDPQNPIGSIPPVLTHWMLDRGLVSPLEGDPLYRKLLAILTSGQRKYEMRSNVLKLLVSTGGYLSPSTIKRRLGLHGDYGGGIVRSVDGFRELGVVEYKKSPTTAGLYRLTSHSREIVEKILEQ